MSGNRTSEWRFYCVRRHSESEFLAPNKQSWNNRASQFPALCRDLLPSTVNLLDLIWRPGRARRCRASGPDQASPGFGMAKRERRKFDGICRPPGFSTTKNILKRNASGQLNTLLTAFRIPVHPLSRVFPKFCKKQSPCGTRPSSSPSGSKW